MRRTILLVAALVLLFSNRAQAQTGAAMLMQPLVNEQELFEVRSDAIFLHEVHTDNRPNGQQAAPHLNMAIYETSGRIREQRERWLPRMGADVVYIDLHGTDPNLPRALTDASFTFALGAENI